MANVLDKDHYKGSIMNLNIFFQKEQDAYLQLQGGEEYAAPNQRKMRSLSIPYRSCLSWLFHQNI
ncbi:unnamed protein product [Ilex paraguariensis]|uniref:Uncharacterized protein n=1 Tax=Ilex paraguariensis TaxID=185542 RepID=A0ABC8T994_9AQUA